MSFTWRRDDGLVLQSSTPVEPAAADTSTDSARRAQIADLMVGFWTYLRTHAEAQPALAEAIAELQSAVAAYQSGDLTGATAALRRTVGAVESVRRAVPALPAP